MHEKAYIGVCLEHHGVSICPSLSQLALSHGHSKLKFFGRWMTKGFWAVSDQGLFSVSNFTMSVLLARWLAPEDYGAFTVALTIFFLLASFHTSFLTEPMLVFGPSRYKGRLSEYLGTLLYGHLALAALSSLLLLLAALGFSLSGSNTVLRVLFTLAFAGPFILLLWLMRRACYARLQPHLATLGSALYLILVLTGVYTVYRLEWVSTTSVFAIMAISSLAVSLLLYARLRINQPALQSSGIVYETLENHWRYGRWAVAISALLWIPQNIYFLLLPLWGGLEATAALKALGNLILPVIQANTALGVLLVPTLAQARGEARFNSLVRFTLVLFVLGPVLYWLLLGMLHRPLVDWLYGGQYVEYAHLLWILGLLPIGLGVAGVFSAALRALERPDKAFWAYAFSTGWILTLGLIMMLAWGIAGATISLLISSVITAATLGYFLITLPEGSKEGAEYR